MFVTQVIRKKIDIWSVKVES